MFLLKKVGMAVIYYIIGYVINTNANYIFASGGILSNAITIPSIIIVSVVLCAVSRYLRIGRLKKNHKGDDSDEKAIFNGEVKGKLLYILKTEDFKLEAVLSVIVGIVSIGSPLLKTGYAVGLPTLFANPANVVLLICWILLMPVLISAVNLLSWYMAYNRVYKKREF